MNLPTPGREQTRRFYDRIGGRYDWFSATEARAKEYAMHQLALEPGLHILNLGVGTGNEHVGICHQIGASGFSCGVDISPVMLHISRDRTGSPHIQADVTHLPLREASFDRVYGAYIFDLLPEENIRVVLASIYRLLRPGGRLVIAALTEGTGILSKALIGAWKAAYSLSPIFLGGCRPLQLQNQVVAAGFNSVSRQVVVQLGMPSEIITAIRVEC